MEHERESNILRWLGACCNYFRFAGDQFGFEAVKLRNLRSEAFLFVVCLSKLIASDLGFRV